MMISPAVLIPLLPLLVKQMREADDVDVSAWAGEAGDAIREYIPEPDVVAKMADLCEQIAADLRSRHR